MKTENYHFQWFGKEDARRTLRASISKEGKLRLGQGLRKQLPPHIRVGFDVKSRVLAIAGGTGADILWPKMGVLNMRALAAEITALGLALPISFQMTDQPNEHCFYGKVIPRKRKQRCDDLQNCDYDMEQLMILYQPVVDSLIYQCAKTTPLPERKSCAWEAFCEAIYAYTPSQGDMEKYLTKRIQTALIEHNKSFTRTYRDRSMEAPLAKNKDNSFRLYDVIPDTSSEDLIVIEGKIMEEQFVESLPPKEKKLYRDDMRRGSHVTDCRGVGS